MRKPPLQTAPAAYRMRSSRHREKKEELRRRLAKAEADLSFYRNKHQWLISALEAQRHARQLLEAGVAASYHDTVSRIREVVVNLVPPNSTIVVVSKGDQDLLLFQARQGWHFPQNEDGVYAGHYPADSAEAIRQLKSLIAKGAEFLLIPNTAFWWLEHYGELKEWLEGSNTLFWRDERCAIYKLSPVRVSEPTLPEVSPRQVSAHRLAPNGADLSNRCRNGQPPDLVCFPIIDWDFRFQRPQHLMLRFAAAGHRVFYLSHQFRRTGESYSLRQIAPALWEVSLRAPRYSIYERVLDNGYRDNLFRGISDLRRGVFLEEAVAMVQSPFWWPLVKEAASRLNWRLVYDCMDHFGGFSTSNPLLVEQERELLSQADLVVAASAFLRRQASRYARQVVLVRNGCDYEHFAKADRIANGARPVIGYYGAIADWFDSDLVADLATRRRDWDFLLVGSTFSADLARLSKLPNVTLPGEKPYAEIPEWLARFDVAILPFKRTALTEAANPVKAYEIFASGKPLVSVPLPEMAALAPLTRLASTVDDFEREIRAQLKRTDLIARRKRRAFARNNTWEKRYQKLSTALGALPGKTSACGAIGRATATPRSLYEQ